MSDNVYEKHTGELVAAHKNASHLDDEEKVKLANVIKTFEDIIQGKAGDFNGSEVEFQLKPNAVLYCARLYRIPHAHIDLMKRAIKEMEHNGLIKEYRGNIEWEAPTFGVPKKNNKGIQIVSDFRKLNEMLKQSPWPMPTIMDMMHQCGGMSFATALDMIMSYYAMRVRQDLQKYLVIVLPWGKYIYKKMPSGLKISTDVFQRELGKLFQDYPFVLVYLDDLLIITKGAYEQHLQAIEIVSNILRDSGMQLNVKKLFFAKQEVDYIGYVINRNGIRPQGSKVEVIAGMAKPKTVTQLRRFAGMINFYRDLWPKRAHNLSHL